MTHIFKTQKRLLKPVVWLTMALLLLVGCVAAKNLGEYRISNVVNKMFESYQVLPDHTYYFTGSNVNPTAIIAIDKHYTLTSADLWTQADVDEKQLRFWVDTMSRKVADTPRGYYILDPSGQRIGLYYSPRGWGPVEMEGERKVSVYLPDEDTQNYRGPRLP